MRLKVAAAAAMLLCIVRSGDADGDFGVAALDRMSAAEGMEDAEVHLLERQRREAAR